MFIGTVIVCAAVSIALGNVYIIVISAVVGLVLGAFFGSCIKKNYGEMVGQMSDIDKINFRIRILISKFDMLKKQYDKEMCTLLLQKIAYEAKKIMAIMNDKRPPIIKEYFF